jgi:hypothetical protein
VCARWCARQNRHCSVSPGVQHANPMEADKTQLSKKFQIVKPDQKTPAGFFSRQVAFATPQRQKVHQQLLLTTSACPDSASFAQGTACCCSFCWGLSSPHVACAGACWWQGAVGSRPTAASSLGSAWTTPLMATVNNGTAAAADQPDAGPTDLHGYTRLHLAASRGNTLVCQQLLKAGADVAATTATGATALHRANGCIEQR